MGYKKTITEESEYGDKKTIVKKVVKPHLVEQDDYQVLLSVAMVAIRDGIQTGRAGNFGVNFIVDSKQRLVKRAESFFTESITKDVDI